MLVNSNRFPVTDEGVVIPKVWFGDATEVEVRLENGQLVVVPVESSQEKKKIEPYSPEDPIWSLGKNPITIDSIDDASTNLDKYLYDDLNNSGAILLIPDT